MKRSSGTSQNTKGGKHKPIVFLAILCCVAAGCFVYRNSKVRFDERWLAGDQKDGSYMVAGLRTLRPYRCESFIGLPPPFRMCTGPGNFLRAYGLEANNSFPNIK